MSLSWPDRDKIEVLYHFDAKIWILRINICVEKT